MSTETDQGTGGFRGGGPQSGPVKNVVSFFNSPSVKLVLIGFVTVILLIPSTFVWILVEERADRAESVARDIARSWGGTQTVNGPYLAVPYTETKVTGSGENEKEQVWRRTAVLFPETLTFRGETRVEERRKSIYKLPVYQGTWKLSGRFSRSPEEMFAALEGGAIRIEPDRAVLVVGIGDVRALKNDVSLLINGTQRLAFEPGLAMMTGPGMPRVGVPQGQAGLAHRASSGIHAGLAVPDWRNGFTFDIDLRLNGSRALYVAPAGQTTNVTLSSDWAHPGFTGAFLPDTREISGNGFSADWTIPYLARGLPKTVVTSDLPLTTQMLGVEFVEPVDVYQTISRSLKYAIGFFSLMFLAVFVLEMRSGWSFHWVQYALVGFALIIFYVMLLALSEHVGYGPAYLIAASAATILNALYVGTSLKSRMAGVVMFSILAAIFAILFALMREQDYALLIGSAIAFVALAITMFVTQQIDWSGQALKAER